ncbi:MAG: sigma-54-dependent transcriptional regulator [Ktedonobacteraceae bacterium]
MLNLLHDVDEPHTVNYERKRFVQRKDRVLEALRFLCVQQSEQRGIASIVRRHTGFSAEEVAEQAEVDRTNASRDLNLLAQAGAIDRFPGRPVLFAIKTSTENTTMTSPLGNSTQHQIQSRIAPPSTASLAPHMQTTHKSAMIAASVSIGAVVTSFDTLIGHNGGLKVAIQQAKAAILYPPRGLHTLLQGPSGVGKTTLARLMHAFALEQQALLPDAPFISFNCADYAGNPQLLMAHLFGVVRGAYTGAEHDRAGLVEQAHRGILFLDEVHRLPPEGQEMLFYLMDGERFRRMGDTRERQASLLLLAATTEDPTTSLLPTFRRRIPMTITLPGLQERTMTERYELIRAFFTTECSSIGVHIHVAPQVLRALLLYDSTGNIGQLRTDVQLICARAYLDYRTKNMLELDVSTDALPEHVRRGLLRTAEMHRALEPLLHILDATHSFTPTGLSLERIPESAHNLYDTISSDLSALRSGGLSEQEINQLLHLDIQHYFQHFADTVNTTNHEQQGTVSHLVNERIAAVSHTIIQYAEEQLERTFPEKLSLVLTLHLMSALEHIAQGHHLVMPALQAMRHTYPIEYEVAHIALLRVRSLLGVSLPESETDVLTVLLANADALLSSEESMVGVVVATHGRGVAQGLAELANTLVGVNSVSFVELTLEQSPEEIVTQVAQSVSAADQGSGVLLLVDFTSLLSLGELVAQRTGTQVRTLANVSTSLVVEAIRRGQRAKHSTLNQLAASLTHVTTVPSNEAHIFSEQKETTHSVSSSQPARVILSVCLTGFGSATKLAELMEERLPDLSRQGVEIICMDINLSGKTEDEVQRLVGNRQIVAIVGTINPHLESYPFLSLTEILFGDGIARLRTLLGGTLIDPALLQHAALPTVATPIFTQRADLIREITHTLSQRLLFLNPTRAVPLIERMIELIEVEVGETFEIEVLAGFILHIACVLERGVQHKGMLVSDKVRVQIEQQFPRELSICRHALQILSSQVARLLPDEEAYNIVGILRQVDIFFGEDID